MFLDRTKKDYGDRDGIDFFRTAKFGSKTLREIDRNNLPKEVLYREVFPYGRSQYDVIRHGTCVVHQLPIHHFPSKVKLPSGEPDEIFAGFVIEDNRVRSKDYWNVEIGGGSFTIYTMMYDPRCLFELKRKVYAGPKGLIVNEPCTYVGVVISLPTEEYPFIGVMGHAQG